MEDELNKLKAEKTSLLNEKSQLAVDLTTLVSCALLHGLMADCMIDDSYKMKVTMALVCMKNLLAKNFSDHQGQHNVRNSA